MPDSIWSSEIQEVVKLARSQGSKQVAVDGQMVEIPVPFPSPGDWRDHWIYFLMLDRFNNPHVPPNHGPWDGRHGVFQGGNFQGVRAQLAYLQSLGVGAIWLSPVFKNCQYNPFTYHGYGFQDFLKVDPRFGTEQELQDLVHEAHARGMYVIFDVVLNHAGDVFEYEGGHASLSWRGWPYTVHWRDEQGNGRSDWTEAPQGPHPDAVVWPKELQNNRYFRRQGKGSEAGGDFESLKELVTEYKETTPERGPYYPVRDLLIKAYQYAVAKYDVDGFRIDTLKYVQRDFARIFGNAMREFALSIGKKNFFTFGEVWDSEEKITRYIGRGAADADDLIGVDAALDFPLFYKLPGVLKGFLSPSEVVHMFEHRKSVHRQLLSSHGEASRYFVTFLDNHDQHSRFYYSNPHDPHRYDAQVSMAVGCLFTLQGIPCLYYGTEQGLHGSGDSDMNVREALWGKPDAFDAQHPFYKAIQRLAQVRVTQPALRYGRQYFREVSGNGTEFGLSTTSSGILAFSRILNDIEILVVANTSTKRQWTGFVIVDFALNLPGVAWQILYSNQGGATAPGQMVEKPAGSVSVFRLDGDVTSGPIRALPVSLKPMEVQILGQTGP